MIAGTRWLALTCILNCDLYVTIISCLVLQVKYSRRKCSSMLSILFSIALSAQVIAASVFSGPQQVASNEYDFIIVGGE